MIDAAEPVVLQATAPSEEEDFYIDWGRETLKSNLTFANDVLRQLLTLNTTLLGGSIAFLDAQSIDPTARNTAIIFFFLSLIVSFLGIMPYEGVVDLRIPAEVQQYKRQALRWKRCYLWAAAGLIAVGFGVAFVGLLTG